MGAISLQPSNINADWQVLPLASNWVQFDTSGLYLPRYRKSDGVVFVEGLARSIAADNNSATYITIATLPLGCRVGQLHSPVLWTSGGAFPIILSPPGNIQITGPIAANYAVWLNYSFLTG